MIIRALLLLVFLSMPFWVISETSPFQTNVTKSNYYSDHHEIVIEAPAAEVWLHLIDLGSWMYDFAMLHHSGPKGAKGEVSTGLAMMTLTEVDGCTVVSVFMNRKNNWLKSAKNPVRDIRNSARFSPN